MKFQMGQILFYWSHKLGTWGVNWCHEYIFKVVRFFFYYLDGVTIIKEPKCQPRLNYFLSPSVMVQLELSFKKEKKVYVTSMNWCSSTFV